MEVCRRPRCWSRLSKNVRNSGYTATAVVKSANRKRADHFSSPLAARGDTGARPCQLGVLANLPEVLAHGATWAKGDQTARSRPIPRRLLKRKSLMFLAYDPICPLPCLALRRLDL